MIETLKGLYLALDVLFRAIEPICRECQSNGHYPDCQGYIWLLPREAKNLLAKGLEIVVVNKKIHFLNSFSDGKSGMDMGRMKPPCPYCKSKRCSIRSLRPLVCRMYPLGFSCEGGKLELVLHADCLFSETHAADMTFINEVTALFERVSSKLLMEITEAYRSVLGISSFPEGPNMVYPVMVLGKSERR